MPEARQGPVSRSCLCPGLTQCLLPRTLPQPKPAQAHLCACKAKQEMVVRRGPVLPCLSAESSHGFAFTACHLSSICLRKSLQSNQDLKSRMSPLASMSWAPCWLFPPILPDFEILFWATQDSSVSMAGLPGEEDAPQQKVVPGVHQTMLLYYLLNIYWTFSFYSSFLLFSFRMSNTGKVPLEYTWMEATDREAMKKPYSTALMRKGISAGS